MVDRPAAVRGSSMLADVLNTPIAELAVCDYVDIGQDFLDAGPLRKRRSVIPESPQQCALSYLVLLQAILEDILYNQAASLAQGNLVPHAAQSLVHILHYLRR